MPTFTIGQSSPLPDLTKEFESTNLKNLFVVGSLSGIPLIKNAIEQGHQVTKTIKNRNLKSNATYDLIIVGAGPGGVSAAIEAKKQGLNYLLTDKGRLFEIVHQYPKGKMIYAEPKEIPLKAPLNFQDKSKEQLLKDWHKQIKQYNINFKENCTVSNITKNKDHYTIDTCKGILTSTTIILAIGDLGSPRKLNIKGEDLEHVHHKLDDPTNYKKQQVLVVGGGNSALEAALALSRHTNVTLSYRQDSFFRASKTNRDKVEKAIKEKSITCIYNSNLAKISKTHASIKIKNKSQPHTLRFDSVFILAGFTPPLKFMEKIKIKRAKTFQTKDIFAMLFVGLIFLWVYAYNKGVTAISNAFTGTSNHLNLATTNVPFTPFTILLFLTTVAGVTYSLYAGIKAIKKIRTKTHTALIGFILVVWLISAFSFTYSFLTKGTLFATDGSFWPYYTLLYSLIVTAFGLYTINKYKKRYVHNRTISLIYSQTILLFILPIFIFKDWRLFFLIYVWPLGPDALTNTFIPTGSLLSFISSSWFTYAGLLLSFVIFTVLVYYKGRGAVCSWFCGCGALAETLGDPFREKTPQGRSAKWLEYASYLLFGFAATTTIARSIANGQWIVTAVVAFFTLFFIYYAQAKIKNHIIPKTISAGIIIGLITIALTGSNALTWYKHIADFGLAGWLALTTYFFIGGRIWCRYFCPLIAYLGIISSIGKFKIRPTPDKCISCNLCTRNCHMGIDVMSYAQKGVDMKEPSCVGCGICVEVCPMDLFKVVYDDKTVGPGTSYQIKANPNKFTILSLGGKDAALPTLLKARHELSKSLQQKKQAINVLRRKGIKVRN